MSDLTPLDGVRSEHFLNGEDLKPITRKEHFYAGQESKLPEGHQEPETREEWFIKKFRGSGGGTTVEALTVTDNGTYSEEGKAYSPVTVNVDKGLEVVALPSAEIVSFDDGEALPITSGKFYINAMQSGSGTPSPDNVRPITGFSSMDITVTPTESASDGTTQTISFGSTNYGGYYDSVNGKFVATYVLDNLGDKTWTLHNNIAHRFTAPTNQYMKPSGSYSVANNAICSCYENLSQNQVFAGITGISGQAITGGSVFAYDENYDTPEAFKTAMANQTICYELAEPIEIDVSSVCITTLEGTNNIYHNCNGNTEISILKEA